MKTLSMEKFISTNIKAKPVTLASVQKRIKKTNHSLASVNKVSRKTDDGTTKNRFGVVTKFTKKHLFVVAQVCLLTAVVFLVTVGTRSRGDGSVVSSADPAVVGGYGGVRTVDEVAAASIAADIAQSAELIVADNVSNLADSRSAQVEFATSQGNYLSKPYLGPTTGAISNSVTAYVVAEGDTIDSIAQKFNITSDTIRWANSIVGNNVGPGRELKILPVSGIIHTVAEGETAQTIAEKYRGNAREVIAFNDAEVAGLKVGQQIVVPNGSQPAPPRSTNFSNASSYSAGFGFGSEPLYGGNGYSYGYCTWHAANRRAEIGRPIPRNLGNAISWASLASLAGFGVGSTPKEGAVVWHRNIGGLGHVAFVENINPDGSLRVSDMNYPIWGSVTYRTVNPDEFGNYLFIY